MSLHMKLVGSLSLGLLIAFGWHFATVFGFFGSAPQTQSEFFIRFGVIVAAFLIISAISAAFFSSKDESAVLPDEREDKIELKADRLGTGTLYILLIAVMWLAFLPMSPIQTANAILAVVCIAELIKIIYSYIALKKGI